MNRFHRTSETSPTADVTPTLPAHNLFMRTTRGTIHTVHAFDNHGYALVLGKTSTENEGRLIRAIDHPDYRGLTESPYQDA